MYVPRVSGSKHRAIFITGTDTGVGKSVVTGLLGRYLSEKGFKVVTQKWIQTGSAGFPADIKLHLKIMGKTKSDIRQILRSVCPYRFKFAGSPHLAAKLENRKISALKIIKSFRLLSRRFDFVIVEGIGGALVPMDKRRLVIDIVKELDLPILLVAQNKLGAVNHTLLTLEALQRRRIKILGIVFNNARGENKRVLDDNPRIIKALTGVKILRILPWEKNFDKLYKIFIAGRVSLWIGLERT